MHCHCVNLNFVLTGALIENTSHELEAFAEQGYFEHSKNEHSLMAVLDKV